MLPSHWMEAVLVHRWSSAARPRRREGRQSSHLSMNCTCSSYARGFVNSAVFTWVSKSNWFLITLHDWLKNSRHFFIQSELQPKPIVTRSRTFSRALRQLRVFETRFDWFPGLSVSFVIGWSDCIGSGFTTLDRKPLQCQVNLQKYK